MKCCICNNEFEYDKSKMLIGHNPEPIEHQGGERCCQNCNDKVVVPARLNGYRGWTPGVTFEPTDKDIRVVKNLDEESN